MKNLRRIQSPRNRRILIACPARKRGRRVPETSEVEVAFGDVVAEMPRGMRFPPGFTRNMSVGDGQRFVSCSQLEYLAAYNKDDRSVVRRLEEFIDHLRRETR